MYSGKETEEQLLSFKQCLSGQEEREAKSRKKKKKKWFINLQKSKYLELLTSWMTLMQCDGIPDKSEGSS